MNIKTISKEEAQNKELIKMGYGLQKGGEFTKEPVYMEYNKEYDIIQDYYFIK